MRHRWLVLMVLLLASCGQPLQRQPTRQPTRVGAAGSPRPTRIVPDQTPVVAPTGGAPLPTTMPRVTAAPLPTALPAPTSSPTPAVIVVPRTAVPQSPEERWRAQQLQRQPFDPPVPYVAAGETTLLWYDPLAGRAIEIGRLAGNFIVTAQFVLRDDNRPALEVPYRINQDYGLTAISPAAIQRMNAAGYTQSVEAYVLQTDAVRPKQ